jgi:hypothetical protein
MFKLCNNVGFNEIPDINVAYDRKLSIKDEK